MSRDETQVATILRELQERAKELNCLYRVDELLNRPELPLELVFRSIVEILPHGWQYPHDCQARIVFENNIVESVNFQPTSWTQSANLVVQGVPVGAVEVSYREQMPRSDEGPFLKEERKLIETIAERISGHIMQRRLKSAFDGLIAARDGRATQRNDWRFVLEFLRDTDPVLLQLISRKLVNHLSWKGFGDAKELLQRAGIGPIASEGSGRRREPPVAPRAPGPHRRPDHRGISPGQRTPQRERDSGLRYRLDQGREVQLPGARAGATGHAAGRHHRSHRALSPHRHR